MTLVFARQLPSSIPLTPLSLSNEMRTSVNSPLHFMSSQFPCGLSRICLSKFQFIIAKIVVFDLSPIQVDLEEEEEDEDEVDEEEEGIEPKHS